MGEVVTGWVGTDFVSEGYCRIEHMFESYEGWLAAARSVMAEYVELRHHIEQLEAHAAVKLAQVIDAYEWPDTVQVPDSLDTYRPEQIGQRQYGGRLDL